MGTKRHGYGSDEIFQSFSEIDHVATAICFFILPISLTWGLRGTHHFSLRLSPIHAKVYWALFSLQRFANGEASCQPLPVKNEVWILNTGFRVSVTFLTPEPRGLSLRAYNRNPRRERQRQIAGARLDNGVTNWWLHHCSACDADHKVENVGKSLGSGEKYMYMA